MRRGGPSAGRAGVGPTFTRSSAGRPLAKNTPTGRVILRGAGWGRVSSRHTLGPRMGRIAVSVGATLVALAFALSTFERWLVRHRRHELVRSGALALFVVAAAALATGAGLGWTGSVFRVFYLFGAILDVPFLALGTVYLLWGARVGDRVALTLGLLGAFAVGVVVTAPFTHPLPRHTLVQGSHVFGVLPRVLAGVGSAGGAAFIVGGAVWSMVRQ